MNKDELWRIFVRRNPTFAKEDDTEVRMTARGLRKLFDQTWDKAFEGGQTTARSEKSFFESIFG